MCQQAVHYCPQVWNQLQAQSHCHKRVQLEQQHSVREWQPVGAVGWAGRLAVWEGRSSWENLWGSLRFPWIPGFWVRIQSRVYKKRKAVRSIKDWRAGSSHAKHAVLGLRLKGKWFCCLSTDFFFFSWPQNARLHSALATNKCPWCRWSSLTGSLSCKTIFLLVYAGKLFLVLQRNNSACLDLSYAHLRRTSFLFLFIKVQDVVKVLLKSLDGNLRHLQADWNISQV